jgi:hypothetical protein
MTKLTTRPQNMSGCALMNDGPGATPFISNAPNMTAMTGSVGMPSVSVGTKPVWAAALAADSGATIPSIAPWPNRSGSRAICFSNV